MAEERIPHIDEQGRARMVDVGEKAVTTRVAVAEAVVILSQEMVERFFSGDLPKGDAAAVARVAGIMAAKKTPELIPLCHPIAINSVEIDLEPTGQGVRVLAKVSTDGRTGVEMEALTAASVSALAIYDMVKGTERHAEISTVRLLRKSGGRSGLWERE